MKIIICDTAHTPLSAYTENIERIAEDNMIELELDYYEGVNELLFAFEDAEAQDFADMVIINADLQHASGFDAAREMRESGFSNDIILVSDSEEYLRLGYDVEASYVFMTDELNENSDAKMQELILRTYIKTQEKSRKYILLTANGEHRYLPVDEIKYFEKNQKTITAFYGSSEFQFYSKLDKLEKELTLYGFFRIHGSYLVALRDIEVVTPKDVTMRNGTKLPVEKRYYPVLKKVLTELAAEQE